MLSSNGYHTELTNVPVRYNMAIVMKILLAYRALQSSLHYGASIQSQYFWDNPGSTSGYLTKLLVRLDIHFKNQDSPSSIFDMLHRPLGGFCMQLHWLSDIMTTSVPRDTSH